MEFLKKITLQDLYKFMSLNFLWILYTLLGLGIFGILPASYALYSSLYQSIKGEEEGNIYLSFHQSFKKNFIRLTILVVPLTFILFILAIDYYFSVMIQSKLLFFVILFLIYYVGSLFHLFFPTMVSKQTNNWETLRHAAKLPFLLPRKMLLIFFYYVVVMMLGMIFPGFFALFLINIPSLLTIHAYIQMEEKIYKSKINSIYE